MGSRIDDRPSRLRVAGEPGIGPLDRIERVPGAWLALALVLVHVLLQAPHLDLPPAGYHVWRQTQTLAVARNLYEESWDVLRPRVDDRGGGPGVAGMEFPLVNLAIAAGYRAFGYSHGLHRRILLLFSCVAVAACFGLFRELYRSKRAGLLAGLALVFSPLFAYYSVTALPDAPMLAPLLAGLWLCARWRRSGRTATFLAGVALLGMAGLIKVSALLALPAVLLCGWEGTRGPGAWRRRAGQLAALGLMLAVVAAWYAWARHLSATSGHSAFRLAPTHFAPALLLPAFRRVLLHWIPGLAVSWGYLPFLLLGVHAVRREGALARMAAAYALALVAFVVVEPRMIELSDYYLMSVMPLLVLLVTAGARRALEWSARDRRIAGATLVVLFGLGPALGVIRAEDRFARARVPADLMTSEAWLDRAVPEHGARVVVATDPSPSTYLYYMHRKGWPVTDTLQAASLRRMAREGAAYLVSDSRALEERPDIAPALKPLDTHGRFRLFRIAP